MSQVFVHLVASTSMFHRTVMIRDLYEYSVIFVRRVRDLLLNCLPILKATQRLLNWQKVANNSLIMLTINGFIDSIFMAQFQLHKNYITQKLFQHTKWLYDCTASKYGSFIYLCAHSTRNVRHSWWRCGGKRVNVSL